MKYFLICIFFLFGKIASAQVNVIVQWQPLAGTEAGDTIHYDNNRRLDWKDFQGTPDNKSIAAAITASGFGYSMSMQTRNNHTSIIITVYCFFDKSHSWVKKGMNTNYALVHEQHHFDITYLHACQFVKRLKAATFTRSNCDELVEKINNEAYAELEKMQNDYDGQTKNGQLKDVQADWNKKIDQLLLNLATN
jgi:FtsZ-binding cell division protein ZapB